VQACIRRWLARTRYQKEKWQVAASVVTLQKFVRGWLTRKRIAKLQQQEREAQLLKKQEKIRQRIKKEKDVKMEDGKKEKKNWLRTKLGRKKSSQVIKCFPKQPIIKKKKKKQDLIIE